MSTDTGSRGTQDAEQLYVSAFSRAVISLNVFVNSFETAMLEMIVHMILRLDVMVMAALVVLKAKLNYIPRPESASQLYRPSAARRRS
jgi:hypothetical protein